MNTKSYLIPTKKYKLMLSSIHSAYRVINSTFELRDLVSRLCRLFSQIFNADYSMILLLDAAKKHSVLRSLNSKRNRCLVVDKKLKITDRIEKKILQRLSSISKPNLLGMPLISEDIIGMVILKRNGTSHHFSAFDQELLTSISELAIIGIKSLQLYEEQQKIILGGIKSLVTLLDTRLPHEYTHSPYFCRLVISIGHCMRLDSKQIESLKFASLLHDTGKADIPIEILTKTSKLTSREYNIVKRHPLKGAQILRPLQILKPVIPIIMHHHEKYNGSGYPSRLKKEQIPQGARIMAVADTFEAMVYGRPYRERVSISTAIKEIKKKSGTQFDPKVVDAFLKVTKRLSKKIYLKKDKKGRYNKKHAGRL
ncbi:MAG: HD domain-containing phosphohydrolase [Candidatus Omnitrophota bacterium]